MVKTFEHQVYFDRFIRLNPSRDTHPKKFLEKIPELVREKVLPKKEKIQIVGGHFAHGIHQSIDDTYDYVTVLRNPVERVISEYYYMKQKGFYYQDLILKENLSLADYLDHPKTKYLNNLQTRLISGIKYENGDEVNEEIYEVALENLRKMRTIGISERFSESLALFSVILDWKKIPIYTKANQNDERPKIETLDKKTLEQIREREKYDIDLYKEALNIFESQLASNKISIEKIIDKISSPSLLRKISKKSIHRLHQLKKKTRLL